ncbi:MerR family transcriptional regulator [Actinomadura fulvescens]|uniref:MerR family transcriptional regulator n=1 Tax=Actinomadura fulvescens TaxID=46160 RepID=A0ABN3QTK6_9ACTN
MELTIDELARRTGITARNLRAYRERGLFPPPVMRGRTGYYGPAHVEQIMRVKRLHDQGFALDLLQEIVEAGEDALRRAERLTRPFTENTAVVVTGAELAALTGHDDPALLRRAVDVGMLRPLGDDRYATVSDRLIGVLGTLLPLGATGEDIVGGMEALRPHTDAIARKLIEMFLPRADRTDPETLERLRAVAPEMIRGLLELSLDAAVRDTIAQGHSKPKHSS